MNKVELISNAFSFAFGKKGIALSAFLFTYITVKLLLDATIDESTFFTIFGFGITIYTNILTGNTQALEASLDTIKKYLYLMKNNFTFEKAQEIIQSTDFTQILFQRKSPLPPAEPLKEPPKPQ